MTLFTEFGLGQPLLKALAQEGYEQPTPIQTKAIPHVMAGRDLCGIAQTGTGKTAAFALPILHRLAAGAAKRPLPKTCRVLVLSPTRELASQIAESFRTYGRHLRLSTTVVFGGVPLGKQERALSGGVDVLVATPGRMLDLIDRRALSLREVEILVLDEADQMLDLGFIHDLKRIVRMLPERRQTLFFSATMPQNIAALAAEYLSDPVQVAVAPVATTAERVEQRVMFVAQGRKQALLETVLRDPAIERVLVFTRTKHGADRVVKGLERAGIEAAAIHGNKSQGQRERALGAFRAGACRVLVATDIAARGIDVEGVSHVVNFELPNVPEQYVHRIGRTARAGAEGVALGFCAQDERPYLRDIEKLTRLKVPVVALPPGFEDAREPEPRPTPQGRPGARPGASAHPAGRKPQGRRPHAAAPDAGAQARRQQAPAPSAAQAKGPRQGEAPRGRGRGPQTRPEAGSRGEPGMAWLQQAGRPQGRGR